MRTSGRAPGTPASLRRNLATCRSSSPLEPHTAGTSSTSSALQGAATVFASTKNATSTSRRLVHFQNQARFGTPDGMGAG
jgi:hypothetical protein